MLSWTVLLFVLCAAMTPSLCCDWLKHYSRRSNTSLTLVHLMGGPLTHQEVLFPRRLYRRIRNAEVNSQLLFIRDSLSLISRLYCPISFSSVTWDTDLTRDFLMSLQRQTDELNTCVSSERPADSRLRRYYSRLLRTLLASGGRPAAWELIRKETKLHLEQLELLASSIRRRSGATN